MLTKTSRDLISFVLNVLMVGRFVESLTIQTMTREGKHVTLGLTLLCRYVHTNNDS